MTFLKLTPDQLWIKLTIKMSLTGPQEQINSPLGVFSIHSNACQQINLEKYFSYYSMNLLVENAYVAYNYIAYVGEIL